MHVCVVTARARVLWPRPDIYCNYYVRVKFKPGAAPGCYDARGNTESLNRSLIVYMFYQPELNLCQGADLSQPIAAGKFV